MHQNLDYASLAYSSLAHLNPQAAPRCYVILRPLPKDLNHDLVFYNFLEFKNKSTSNQRHLSTRGSPALAFLEQVQALRLLVPVVSFLEIDGSEQKTQVL